jgi:S1-C subfamily serine protease
VLSILRITPGTDAARQLRVGDLLLAVDGEPVATFAGIERRAQAERVRLTVLRDREEIDLDVETTPLDGHGTDRFVLWAGALLQAPHPAVAHQYGVETEGVYVSWLWFGSPASRSDLLATDRIVEFDGEPIRDLDAFLAAVEALPEDRPVRFKSIDLDGKIAVVTLKPDDRFWPTVEIRRGRDGWERIDHGSTGAPAKAKTDG